MSLQAETSFGLQFLQTLPVNESAIFSPLSIALALSLVHAGAKGKTKSQISNTLLKGSTDEQFTQYFSLISNAILNSTNGVTTNVANRVYLNEGFIAKQSYLDFVEKNYNAGAESLDFTNPTSADKINAFVENATKNKIVKLTSYDAIKDAVAFLVNALYFEADWQRTFSTENSKNDAFFSSPCQSKNVTFMHDYRTDRAYSSDDTFQVLVLPYKDSSYKFAIFLPKQRNGLANGMKKLTAAKFQNLLKNAKSTYLNIAFPKFKIEKQMGLKATLIKLGIQLMFSDAADLSGIAESLTVTDGIHKAMIEITEKGTVAAAATGIIISTTSIRNGTPLEFRADHPFMFALVKDNHPMFLGTYQG